jgi:hypothetical protein
MTVISANNFTLTSRFYVYQSMQQLQHEFDLRYLLGALNLSYKIPGEEGRSLRLELGSSYYHAMVHEFFYSQGVKITPQVVVGLSATSNIMLGCEVLREWYPVPTFSDFDLTNWSVRYSFSQNFLLWDGKVNAWYGYRWGKVDAGGEFYNRVDNAGMVGVIATLPAEVQLLAQYNYEQRDYPTNVVDRFERRSVANLSLAIPVTEEWDLYLGGGYSDIQANVQPFTYQRWILSLGVQTTRP